MISNIIVPLFFNNLAFYMRSEHYSLLENSYPVDEEVLDKHSKGW